MKSSSSSTSTSPCTNPSRSAGQQENADCFHTPMHFSTLRQNLSQRSSDPALSDPNSPSSPVIGPATISTPVTSRNICTPSAPIKPGSFRRPEEQESILPHIIEESLSSVAASLGNLQIEEKVASHPTKRARLETSMVSIPGHLNATKEDGWSTVPMEKVREYRHFVSSDSCAIPSAPSGSDSRRVSMSDRTKNSSRLKRGYDAMESRNRVQTPAERLREKPTHRSAVYKARRRNFFTEAPKLDNINEQND